MTGFSALPTSEEDTEGEGIRWEGTSEVYGPKWARLPLLTIGLLGVQVIWSVEMSYGEFSLSLLRIYGALCVLAAFW